MIKTIEDLSLNKKTVIVRTDFNVPINNGQVENDKRLRESLPTIQYLVKQGAKIVLMSHLGRPNGEVVESMRMTPIAESLSKLLGQTVKTVQACIGIGAEKTIKSLEFGEVLLLENLRFYPEETQNETSFAQSLSKLATVYINDAFGTAHRAHASTAGIASFFEEKGIGFLMKKELNFLGDSLKKPKRPFVAIIGGAKITDKIEVIEVLLDKVDYLIIGGGMAYTFLKSQGLEIGKSLCEDERLKVASALLKKAEGKIVLPVDAQATAEFNFKNRTMAPLEIVDIQQIPVDKECVDIGPKTQQIYFDLIQDAKTVIWNGPMGVFEVEESSKGTFKVADGLVDATKKGAITIVGGGDSVAAVEQAGVADQLSHVSTGGGASLEFLEGKKLPGVEALKELN